MRTCGRGEVRKEKGGGKDVRKGMKALLWLLVLCEYTLKWFVGLGLTVEEHRIMF